MRRIDTATKAVDLFGAGKHGFKNGDAANAILATKLRAEWFNALQEEVASLIEGAGFALDPENNTQLSAAIGKLIVDNSVDTLNTARIDVASAAAVNLTTLAPNTRHINITGTTTITSFTVAAGRCYFVRFAGVLTLTNGASLVTQTGANIVTAVGDTCILRATAANVVEVFAYVQADNRIGQVLSREYTSPPTAFTAGGLITFLHGLGAVPKLIGFELTCIVAQGGYAAGDVLYMPPGYAGAGGSSGMITRADGASIYLNIGASGIYTLSIPSGSGGIVLTPASWTLKVRAFA